MKKRKNEDLPGQIPLMKGLSLGKSDIPRDDNQKENTIDDLKSTFKGQVCSSLKQDITKEYADFLGYYCEVFESQCIYPRCKIYTPVA